MIPIFFLLLGLAILTAGAEVLVRGASALALRIGLSHLAVGLTVVALGTSAPELAVTTKAALAGQGGIAMGNVIGSNIFNVAVILGLAALICPLTVHLKVVRVDTPIMLVASALFTVLFMTGGSLNRWEGSLLVAALLAYTAWTLVESRREEAAGAVVTAPEGAPPLGVRPAPFLLSAALVVAGLVMLMLGARLLIDNASVIARQLGVSETVIGLTIVAAGTSLPELATSLVAAFRRQTDLAIGNIVGSNIFNLLGIAGAASLLAPIQAEGIKGIDLGAMLATSFILLPFMRSGFRLVRWEGAVLLASYLLYLRAIWPA